MTTNIANFRRNCAKLIGMVQSSRAEIVITKHGKPVVKISPIGPAKSQPYLGVFTDIGETRGDLTEPFEREWELD